MKKEEIMTHINNGKNLALAIAEGKLDEVKRLIALKPQGDPYYDLESALQCATLDGHLEIVEYLVKQGANIHDNNDDALRFASKFGYLDIVKYLVKVGGDIHAIDEEGDNALIVASYAGQLDVVKYLVQYGSDIHYLSNEAISSASGHPEVLKYLKLVMKMRAVEV